jgi:hypothetical protein
VISGSRLFLGLHSLGNRCILMGLAAADFLVDFRIIGAKFSGCSFMIGFMSIFDPEVPIGSINSWI